LGCPGRLKGLAAGIVISWCCCSSCCLPTPISGNAESVLETTRGCPAAMMYAPSDVSISKNLHVYRAAAAPHRGGAVIGLQRRYQRMCCTRRRVCRRARADAGRCAIAIWTVAVDAVDADSFPYHRRRAAIVAETTGALGVFGGLRSPIVGYGFLARWAHGSKNRLPLRDSRGCAPWSKSSRRQR
jgi:hypothetical protein